VFDGIYQQWNQKRIKCILDYYGGHTFFFHKKLLDLGCGYGDIGAAFYRLGSQVTAVDARPEHLKMVNKKFAAGIKTMYADLDRSWPFKQEKFDIILDLALVCHLRDYEKHLNEVCQATNYLVLETAVCDSEDPFDCVMGTENKGIYDLSINGISCRPSSAAIERILTNNNMSFERLDRCLLNSPPFVYDWDLKHNLDQYLNRRRLWFAKKNNPEPIPCPPPPPHKLIGGHIASNNRGVTHLQNSHCEVIAPPVILPPPTATVLSPPHPVEHVPPTHPPPMRAAPQPRPPHNATNITDPIYKSEAPPKPFSIIPSNFSSIKESSRQFSVLHPETNLQPGKTFTDIVGTIYPLTYSACLWFRKVFPLFPSLTKDKRALSLQGFPNGNAPNLVICSIDNICQATRLWIEEWANKSLTEKDIGILKNCPVILTPSIFNAHEILQAIPNAKIIRCVRPWPTFVVEPRKQDSYIYFEKSAYLTEVMLSAWQPTWGKLHIVGSSLPLPDCAQHISDTEDYLTVLRHLTGAKAIIDINFNTNYKSGLLDLAKCYQLPIITNNTHYLEYNLHTLIHQDKVQAPYPTSADIIAAMTKYLGRGMSCADINANSCNYNEVYASMKQLLGL
jgi:SAM-dependent methyltransferase